ncbi:bacteriocin immunity protein [Streptococcus catagoni]|uniref:bacteriocin immunity protein n=1 Tax=Streptococcus catagoni TaxID=2654874 RepID=UPI00140E3816|nr:bacteriocin immunity protein [Streptococcus catagoni]
MEKASLDFYKQIVEAYDHPENRENAFFAAYLLSASNKLINNQNLVVIARDLNKDLDAYIRKNQMSLPRSLYALKETLGKYLCSESEVS